LEGQEAESGGQGAPAKGGGNKTGDAAVGGMAEDDVAVEELARGGSDIRLAEDRPQCSAGSPA
jgi:hypothetical protein